MDVPDQSNFVVTYDGWTSLLVWESSKYKYKVQNLALSKRESYDERIRNEFSRRQSALLCYSGWVSFASFHPICQLLRDQSMQTTASDATESKSP